MAFDWGILAGPAQVVGDMVSTGVNAWQQHEANVKNEQLMRESWARDDTAVQRRVADLKAAGLNPVLAAGGSGSPNSGPIRVNPMEVSAPDFSKAYAAAIGGAQNQMIKSQAARAATEAVTAEIQQNNLAADARTNIERNKALLPYQEGLVKTQVDIANMQAAKAAADAKAALADASIRSHDAAILEKFPGMLSSSTGATKDIMGILGMIGNYLDQSGIDIVPRRVLEDQARRMK